MGLDETGRFRPILDHYRWILDGRYVSGHNDEESCRGDVRPQEPQRRTDRTRL